MDVVFHGTNARVRGADPTAPVTGAFAPGSRALTTDALSIPRHGHRFRSNDTDCLRAVTVAGRTLDDPRPGATAWGRAPAWQQWLRRIGFGGIALVTVALLFSAQELLRAGAAGSPQDWTRTLTVNLIDWAPWVLITPALMSVARRYRLDAGNRVARIGIWLAVAAVSCVAVSLSTAALLELWGPFGPISHGAAPPGGSAAHALAVWVTGTAGWNTLVFGMITGALHAALYYQDLRQRQLRELDLESRLARAELDVLRMQLQPHFLFNALHTVAALMVADVPGAQRVVAALGDLLRLSTDHTARQEITLRDELAFVGRYADIQRARFRDRLAVHVDVVPAALDGLVPSFVLQPLVENAIRHGIEPFTRNGQLWIVAERSGDQLTLVVRDDGAAGRATEGEASPETSRAGTGLSNLAARLAQLYGARQSFAAGPDAMGDFRVSVSLPFHTEPVFGATERGPQ